MVHQRKRWALSLSPMYQATQRDERFHNRFNPPILSLQYKGHVNRTIIQ